MNVSQIYILKDSCHDSCAYQVSLKNIVDVISPIWVHECVISILFVKIEVLKEYSFGIISHVFDKLRLLFHNVVKRGKISYFSITFLRSTKPKLIRKFNIFVIFEQAFKGIFYYDVIKLSVFQVRVIVKFIYGLIITFFQNYHTKFEQLVLKISAFFSNMRV